MPPKSSKRMWTSTKWFHTLSVLILTALACVIVARENAALSDQEQNRQYQNQTATTANQQLSRSTNTSGNQQYYPARKKRNHDSALQWATLIAACIAAGATIAYAVFSYRQWKATEAGAHASRDAVVIATDTAQRELRAYVNLEFANIVFAAPIPTAQVRFQNFGHTPAYDVHHWIAIGISPYPWSNPAIAQNVPIASKGIVGPSAQIGMTAPLSRPLLPHDDESLSTPQFAIWVCGEINYRDAFDISRYTKYRLFCGGPRGIAGGELHPDAEGNEAN